MSTLRSNNIPQGSIVAAGIKEFFDAQSVKANFEHQDTAKTGTYNISGVSGDYKIVKYLTN